MKEPCASLQGALAHIPSSSLRVTVGSTYSHQCLPSVDTGISQLDHLQARWMHTQATTGGLYCRQKVVRWRLRGSVGPGRARKGQRDKGKKTQVQCIDLNAIGFARTRSARAHTRDQSLYLLVAMK